MSERDARSPAEWITFAVASMVVAAVVLAIGIEIPGSKTPAHPVVHTADAVARGADFSVAVTVENEGQKTAQNVQVEASLDTGSGEETSDQVVAFLAGQASEELVFIFSSDPGEGRLRVRVTGFLDP